MIHSFSNLWISSLSNEINLSIFDRDGESRGLRNWFGLFHHFQKLETGLIRDVFSKDCELTVCVLTGYVLTGCALTGCFLTGCDLTGL